MKMKFTIFVFIALAAFDNIIIGLFPPLFQYIAQDLKVGIAKLGIISAINILVTAISSVYWGYLSGKFKRKRLNYDWNFNLGLIRIFNIDKPKLLQLLLFQI